MVESPKLTVSIATHNRVDDLMRTLDELASLRPPPDEIIVCADTCTDGTEEAVRDRFPSVRLLVNEVSLGSIGSRDRIIRGAQGQLILTLDDDSYPCEKDFVAYVKSAFKADSDLGILTFPQRSNEFPETLTQDDFGPPLLSGTYTSSGAVIRKDLYEQLGGYPVFFYHAFEEPDFSMRVIDAGYKVVCDSRRTVRHHYTGVMRNEVRTHHRHARNECWSNILRAPAWAVLPICLKRAAGQFGYACRRGPAWMIREPRWWFQALGGLPTALRSRRPVSWQSYRRWISLVRHPQPLTERDAADPESEIPAASPAHPPK